MTIDEIAVVMDNAASRLFEQFRYSNGFTSVGQSALAEAALVAHIAAEFINHGHAVWPESPFRTAKRGRTKRLDLLIQLEPIDLQRVDVLTFEGKAISKGFESKKVTEIIADHSRVCDWRLLDPTGKPIFFSLEPPQSVRGALAVLLTEDEQDTKMPQSLSSWWTNLSGQPFQITLEKAEALKRILASAAKRDTIRSSIPLGNARLSVAYAIFTCEDPNSQDLVDAAENERTAEHEAGHALIAVLCGFKVDKIALHASGKLRGGTHINWKASRGTISDEELLEQAFAVAYAGCIVEMNRSGKGIGETLNELPTDLEMIKDIRETAITWGIASDVNDTARVSEHGMVLGVTMIQQNEDLVAHLADELLAQGEMNEDAIQVWFEEHRNR